MGETVAVRLGRVRRVFATLIALAATCKYLSDPALNMLYHTVPDIAVLFYTLPDELYKRERIVLAVSRVKFFSGIQPGLWRTSMPGGCSSNGRVVWKTCSL